MMCVDSMLEDKMEQRAVIGEEAKMLMRGCKSREEIDRLVRRGRQLRALHLAAWGAQMFETWKSLFRRPGSVIPVEEK